MRHIEMLKQDEDTLINVLLGNLAVNKIGEPCACSEINCIECSFHNMNVNGMTCNEQREMWLKDLPMSKITKNERKFLETIGENFYITRDADGCLRLHEAEPIKSKAFASWSSDKMSMILQSGMFKIRFPFITWENETPTKVKDLLMLPVGDDE